ncbi:NAD-P-binding protein [Trametes versicolor FP-101664 SS1]|uniref:NAD-P-binding protein n=1 Tax=Trametes versicolor (strain FP-101664) TaxID=717944 RepID=UPI0004622CEF|nr:NAD-P-binding protein [Trametes versicolor FP-101664 SS1]EIW53462.1 NAD-P-binding protein [Trametes versicolor FP-101664 SS1]
MSDSQLNFTVPALFDVKGKVAVVTGGGSGIGTMIAAAYVQNGAKVYIASRKEQQLKEVSESLTKKGPGSCHYIVADISSKAGCEALANAIKERESKVHILVNNSGASWGAPFEDFPEQGWDKVIALNVKSIFYMTAALTPLLAKDATGFDPGRVINISSVAGFLTTAHGSRLASGNNGLWSYGTSKAAVNHLTILLATTLAPKFITVNAILPGVFPSKMTAYALKQLGEEGLSQGNPFGRIGHPKDMAGVALFLASPAGAYVSGSHIVLDGATAQSRIATSL